MSTTLGLVSFNVRGIRDTVKRRAIFRHLHVKYPRHLAILQETHSSSDIENRWKAEWGGKILFAHGETNARGVCVLIPKGFRGDVILLQSELGGRLVIVRLEFSNVALNMLGIYAPTQRSDTQQVQFYKELNDCLSKLDDLPILICGDLYLHSSVADIDNSRYRDTPRCKILREIMSEFDLVDIWRELNPHQRRFTWRRCHPFQQSRLDYFLISNDLMRSHKVVKTEIEPGIKSDHSVVV